MFETQLGLRENPFLAGHNSEYVYPSQEHEEALAQLRAAIQNRESFVLITGDPGTGKSTAAYEALGECGARAVVARISNPKVTPAELVEEIRSRFSGASPEIPNDPAAPPELQSVLSAIRARGELAILLLDDAHLLDGELIEKIGPLTDLEMEGEPLLQVFLVGRPALEAKLAHPELRELLQRIQIRHRMSPLSSSDTARFIHHRVAAAGGNPRELFPTDTCIEVFRLSNGYPREINKVAGQALLNALGEGSSTVTMEHVAAVEREIEFQGTLRERAQAVTPLPTPIDEGYMEPSTDEPYAEGPKAEPYPETAEGYPGTPATEAYAENPIAERYAERESDREPMPTLDEMLSSMNASAPAVQPKPELVPAPVAKTVPQLSVPGTGDDAPLQILPSWFDEVVARRQQIDEGAAPAPTPATMRSQTGARPDDASPAPIEAPSANAPRFTPFNLTSTTSADDAMFGPTAQTPSSAADLSTAPPLDSEWSSSANAPAFVPLAPAMARESESATAADLRASILPPTTDAASESSRSAMAVDLLAARLRAEFADVEQQAAVRRTGFGWLVGAAVIAVVAIAAILLIRFGLLTLVPEDSAPAAASAPQATQVTPSSTAPVTRSTRSAPMPADGGSGMAEPAPSKSGNGPDAAAAEPTQAGSTPPAANEVKSPATAPVTEAPRSTATAPSSGPSSQSAFGRVATATPSRAASTGSAKKPAIVPNLFGIAVGTFLDEKRATAQRTSVTESTRLPSQVITVIEDTVSMYRVVVGSFEDRVSAERAASDLVRRGLVDEARVIQLARATPPAP